MSERGGGARRTEGPGYETRDVNVRAVTLAGLALLAVVAIAALAMVVVFNMLAARESRKQPERSPLAAALSNERPPEPRLQTSPTKDIREMRAAEDEMIGHYGWVDAKAGVVRLPLDRAEDLVVAKGLPARKAPGAPAPEANP